MTLVTDALLLGGALLLLLAALGVARMTDPFDRIRFSVTVATLGALLFLLGLAARHPGWSPKLLCIGACMLLIRPILASVLARPFDRASEHARLAERMIAPARRLAQDPRPGSARP